MKNEADSEDTGAKVAEDRARDLELTFAAKKGMEMLHRELFGKLRSDCEPEPPEPPFD